MSLAYLFDSNIQFQDRSGNNNVNGFLRVYIDNTDDRAVTYKDFNGTLNQADIRLDNNGRAVVIVDDSKTYRLEVYGTTGVLLWTLYPISPKATGINETLEALVAAVKSHTIAIEGLALGKKNKQQAKVISGTPTQTVKSISQNADGEITVEFEDIAFPHKVLVDEEDSVPKHLEDAVMADELGKLRVYVGEREDSTPENPDKVLVIDDHLLREDIDSNSQRIENIEETIADLDVDSVPHAYLHSTLNRSPGDNVSTRTTIDVFSVTAIEGDCFEFEQTTTIDDTPFGYVWIEPGTYLINASVTLQWVGDPRGTFIAKVGKVMGENFDFSQEQEISRQSTKVVTIQSRMKLAVNVTYDKETPVMGFLIQSMQVVKLAGGMSQTNIIHDDTLVGQGSVSDPLGVDEVKIAQSTLAGNLAPAFDPTRTGDNPYIAYKDRCVYNGELYECTVEHSGTWNPSHFQKTNSYNLSTKFISFFQSLERVNVSYPNGVESFVTGKELELVNRYITITDNVSNACKLIPVSAGDVVKISAYPDSGVNTYSFVSYDGVHTSVSGSVNTRTYHTRFVTAEYDGVFLVNTSTISNTTDCAYKFDRCKDKSNIDSDTAALALFNRLNVEDSNMKTLMHSDGYYSASSFTGMPIMSSCLNFRLRLYAGQKVHITSTGTDYASQPTFFFVTDAGVVQDIATNDAYDSDYTAVSSGVAYFNLSTKPDSSLKIRLIENSKVHVPQLSYLTINGTEDILIDNTAKTIIIPHNVSIRNGMADSDYRTISAGSMSFIPPVRAYYGSSVMGYITYQYGRSPALQLKMYGEKIDTYEYIIAVYVADRALFDSQGRPNVDLTIQKVWSINPIKIKVDGLSSYPSYVLDSNAFYLSVRNAYISGSIFKAIHITDMHGDFRALDGVAALKSKFNLPTLPVLCTGDSPRYTASQMTADEISAVVSKYLEIGAYICIGQHEIGWNTNKSVAWTTQQAFDTWIAPLKDGWGLSSLDKCYYFKDFDEQKVRLIVLYQYEAPMVDDPSDSTKLKYARGTVWYSQAQIDWLISTLGSVPTGYRVILMRHQSDTELSNTSDNDFTSLMSAHGFKGGNIIIAGTPIEDIIQAYIDKTSLTNTYSVSDSVTYPLEDFPSIVVSADFSSALGSFAFHIGGDSHADCVGKVYGTGKTQRYVMMTASGITSTDCSVAWATFGDLNYSVIINGLCLYGNRLIIGRCGQQVSMYGQTRSLANVPTTIS